MTESTAPAKAPRLPTLDALRGMAILGILAVNASFFASTLDQAVSPAAWWAWPQTDASLTVFWAMQTVFEAKMVTMFAMLFGVSMYLVGGEKGDPHRSPVLRRRLWWLLLFGALHGLLIWYGDILVAYAIGGFVALLFRSRPAGWLIKVGFGFWLALGVFGLLTAASTLLLPADIQAQVTAGMAPPPMAYRSGYAGDFVQSLLANMQDYAFGGVFIELALIFFATPLMLLGLGLFKAGVFRGEAPTRTYLTLIAVGLTALLLIGAFTGVDVLSRFNWWGHRLSDSLTSLTALPITLAYGSLLILGLRAGGAAAAIPNLLRPVGRMAFTNYLTQSLIMTGLFYGGRGPGWFQEVDRPGLALIVVSIWVLQIVWSHLWLSRFEMGPFEWVWRSLVAKRAVPITRASASPSM